MCDLLDCRNCKHKCKNDLNDNEIEDLWREWEDVAFVESEDKKLILVSDWQGWSKGTCNEEICNSERKNY